MSFFRENYDIETDFYYTGSLDKCQKFWNQLIEAFLCLCSVFWIRLASLELLLDLDK